MASADAVSPRARVTRVVDRRPMEMLAMNSTPVLILLVLLNVMVLSGQLWPEAAPPFARSVNLAFLVLALIHFLLVLYRRRSSRV